MAWSGREEVCALELALQLFLLFLSCQLPRTVLCVWNKQSEDGCDMDTEKSIYSVETRENGNIYGAKAV